MPRIDYYGIEQQIKSVLETDASLSGVNIYVEEEILFGAEQTPAIYIYLESREAPPEIQRLSAGQQTTYHLRFSIQCVEFSLESVNYAIMKRDELIGKVEIALMKNRTLNNSVTMSWLLGGDMPSGKNPEQTGFVSIGEIILIAEVTATI